MPGGLGDHPLLDAVRGSAGGEARPQAVAGKPRRVEAGGRRTPLHDEGHGPVGQGGPEPPVPVDRAEHPPLRDPGGGEPALVGRGRAGRRAGAPDRDALPLPLLVALAAPDRQPQALGGDGDVGNLQSNQLGAAQGRAEADEQEGAVARVDQARAEAGEQAAGERHGQGLGPALGAAPGAAQAAQHVADRGVAGVEVVPGQAVGDADAGEVPGQGGERAGVRVGGEVETDRRGGGRERREAVPGAPGREPPPVRPVGAPRRGRARALCQPGRAVGELREVDRRAQIPLRGCSEGGHGLLCIARR